MKKLSHTLIAALTAFAVGATIVLFVVHLVTNGRDGHRSWS